MNLRVKSAIAGLAVSLTAALPSYADDVTIKLASTVVEKATTYPFIVKMIEEIENADVGITVQFFPASQLGSGEELLEDAKFGNVDMVHAAVYAQADPRIEYMDLPFAITTLEELQATMGNPDSEYNKILAEILQDHGLKHLGSIAEGTIGIVANKMPANVHGVGDQDMSIRVWSSQLAKLTMDTLGYQTTTMSWAEVIPAVQAKIIDGAICCTSEGAYSYFALSDIGSIYIPYNAFIDRTILYMSGQSWAKLTPEQQAAIQTAATNAAQGVNESAWALGEEYIAKLRDEQGWTVVEFTEEERAAIKEAAIENVWPTLADLVGQDILDRMTAN